MSLKLFHAMLEELVKGSDEAIGHAVKSKKKSITNISYLEGRHDAYVLMLKQIETARKTNKGKYILEVFNIEYNLWGIRLITKNGHIQLISDNSFSSKDKAMKKAFKLIKEAFLGVPIEIM